jgi:hypothetical protein
MDSIISQVLFHGDPAVSRRLTVRIYRTRQPRPSLDFSDYLDCWSDEDSFILPSPQGLLHFGVSLASCRVTFNRL